MSKQNPAQLVIKNVRFAFVNVFAPDDLSGRYSVRILIPKNSPQLGEIRNCIQAAVTAGAATLKGKSVSWNEVVHDGDLPNNKGEQPHPGFYYLNAKAKNKPGVVKVNPTGIGGKTMAITDDAEFYSGCYGWADVGFFAFNQGVNSGVTCRLNNVLKTGGEDGLGNGQFMGGRASAESVFGAELGDEDELS